MSDLQELAKAYKEFKLKCDKEYADRCESARKSTIATREAMKARGESFTMMGDVQARLVDDSFEAFLSALPTTN